MFPQAELRRFEQAMREAALRTAELPEQSETWRQEHAEYLVPQRLISHQNSPKMGINYMLNIWHPSGLLRHQNNPICSASTERSISGIPKI
ncbi:unnamed protein product [Arctia plantaginis]|uniref:Uncharacterized protein n=1 Tax=Arctia plantaginis TaxID=874455 RepID=A0A8S0YWN5_ARCPL|nr:unnamed protein product [Arctia plantaginis]CAB3229997.1 unnamed protein product [Arctia plantaginis]